LDEDATYYGVMVSVGGHVLFEYGDVKLVSVVASVRKSILAYGGVNTARSSAASGRSTHEKRGGVNLRSSSPRSLAEGLRPPRSGG